MIQTFVNRFSDVIVKPKFFFDNMELDGGYKDPLVFSYIVFFCVTILGVILYLLGMPQMIVIADIKKELTADQLSRIFFLRTIAWGAEKFLTALICHIGFKSVGGTGNYESNYRIVTYTTPAYVFNLIPRIGIFIYCFYFFYLVIIGGKVVHKLSIKKAIIGTLMPFFFIMVVLSFIIQSFR